MPNPVTITIVEPILQALSNSVFLRRESAYWRNRFLVYTFEHACKWACPHNHGICFVVEISSRFGLRPVVATTNSQVLSEYNQISGLACLQISWVLPASRLQTSFGLQNKFLGLSQYESTRRCLLRASCPSLRAKARRQQMVARPTFQMAHTA